MLDFIVSSIELDKAVSDVEKALGNKKLNQAFGSILIAADKDKQEVKFATTNGILRIESVASANVLVAGETLVEGDLFANYAHKVEGDISIVESENYLTISAKGINATLGTFGTDIFPIKQEDNNEAKFTNITVSQGEFKQSIKECLISVSKEEARPILKGICIKKSNDEGYLDIVACDGYRLTKRQLEYESVDSSEDFSAIVPASNLRIISAFLKDETDSKITLQFIANQLLSITANDVCITSNLLAGDYINYGKIIPQNSPNKTTVKIDKLKKAIDLALTLASQNKTTAISVTMGATDLTKTTTISFRANSARGRSESTVDGVVVYGLEEEFKFGINGQFLLDVLKTINEDEVYIETSKPTLPILVTTAKTLFMILPLRVIG